MAGRLLIQNIAGRRAFVPVVIAPENWRFPLIRTPWRTLVTALVATAFFVAYGPTPLIALVALLGLLAAMRRRVPAPTLLKERLNAGGVA